VDGKDVIERMRRSNLEALLANFEGSGQEAEAMMELRTDILREFFAVLQLQDCERGFSLLTLFKAPTLRGCESLVGSMSSMNGHAMRIIVNMNDELRATAMEMGRDHLKDILDKRTDVK